MKKVSIMCFCIALFGCNESNIKNTENELPKESCITDCLTKAKGLVLDTAKTYLLLSQDNGCLACSIMFLKDSSILNQKNLIVVFFTKTERIPKMVKDWKRTDNFYTIYLQHEEMTKCCLEINSIPLLLRFKNKFWYSKVIRQKSSILNLL